MKTSVFCPKCGAPIYDNQAVCSECGTVLSGRDKKDTSYGNKKNDVNDKWRLKNIIAAIFLVALGAAVSIGVMSTRVSLRPGIIPVATSIELEAGEEKEIQFEILNYSASYVVTYDECSIVSTEWMKEEAEDSKVVLLVKGLEEGEEQLHVYLCNKHDSERKIVEEAFIDISVKTADKLYLKADTDRVDVSVNESVSMIITLAEDAYENFSFRYLVPDSVGAEWGEWVDGYSIPITISGNYADEGIVVISLYDKTENEDGTYVGSIEIPFKVWG